MKRIGGFILFVLLVAGCEEGEVPLDAGGEVGDVGRIADSGPTDTSLPDAMRESDGGSDAGVLPDVCEGPTDPGPARILFVGNSFTFTANMPATFEALAVAGGFAPEDVQMRALGGQPLAYHRADTATGNAPSLVRMGWDVVVLQEFSTRPTDSVGPAEQFKIDATWFYDLAVEANPEVRVVLYETFARRYNHPIYPGTFDDPEDMQAQLRFHYEDCVFRYIPAMSTAAFAPPVELARVGDAWERVLMAGEPPRLHTTDDYHPSAEGAYLTALVFFGNIYHRSTVGLPSMGIDEAIALELQETADFFTGATRPAPSIECPPELPVGDSVRVDFGPDAAAGWTTHASINGSSGPLTSVGGESTGIVVRTRAFTGTQTGGSAANDLGYPAAVTQDTLWVGSFDSHAAALGLTGQVTLSGLNAGTYELELFASRDGSDGGAGRLTRFTIGADHADLDVADNQGRTAMFSDVLVDDGTLSIDVGVSPDGTARFGYIGSLSLRRTR